MKSCFTKEFCPKLVFPPLKTPFWVIIDYLPHLVERVLKYLVSLVAKQTVTSFFWW